MNKLESLEAKEQEPTPRLAYLGPAGTFTELASIELRKNKYSEHLPIECASITDICECVASGKVQLGIVPIENSTAGDVRDTVSALVRLDLQIIDELIIPISQNVFIRKDAKPDNIRTIKTKDQAYYQSSQEKLQKLFPGHKFIPIASTALGVKMAAEDPTIAAIGTPNAAQALGLEDKLMMIKNIEENPFNATVFVVIQKSAQIMSEITGHDKTTFIASLIDKSGSLYHYLDALRAWKISLNKIRSLGKTNGDYIFLISIDGHITEERVRKIMQFNPNREKVPSKILGSYKRAEYTPPRIDTLPPIDYLIRQITSEMENRTTLSLNEVLVLFTLNDETGALAKALCSFAQRDINLTAIDSMPTRRKMGEYAFYLACDKNAKGLDNVFQELRSQCTQFHFI